MRFIAMTKTLGVCNLDQTTVNFAILFCVIDLGSSFVQYLIH